MIRRRLSWFSLTRPILEYRWPHPLARPAIRWIDRSLYLPWLVAK